MQKSWDPIRAEIERIIEDKDIKPADFRALSMYDDWSGIEEKIYAVFCNHKSLSNRNDWRERPVWLWEHFKLETHAISSDYSASYKYLAKLVDADEIVWFFVNGDRDKFWFYEGKIDSIVTVIGECCCIDELYVASKKYRWLININHHDSVFATGEIMPDRLRALKSLKTVD